MPSNKKSLSEEQIFADIMEMISSSNKKSKNVKNNNSKNKKNSKKNLKGGFSPLNDSTMDMSKLSPIGEINVGPNSGSDAGFIMKDQDNASGPMGNSGVLTGSMMSGGKKRRIVKKSGVKKAVKKSVTKKVKKVGAKKVKKAVKKVGTKKRVAKKSGAKKVAKKSKRVAKK